MGLTGAETILIHSSMKSIGRWRGAQIPSLDALMEYFAQGLLLLPTPPGALWMAEIPCSMFGTAPAVWASFRSLFRQRPGCDSFLSTRPTVWLLMVRTQRHTWRVSWKPARPVLRAAVTIDCGQFTARSCCWGHACAQHLYSQRGREVLNVPAPADKISLSS